MKKLFLLISFINILITSISFASTEMLSRKYTSSEAFSRMIQLKEQGKIPAYVVERGTYKYVEGNNSVRVTGKNVFMRSQPQRNARIINKISYSDLEYLGEWTHPTNGERWFCVRKNAYSEIGWIYGQYVNYIKENVTKVNHRHVNNSKVDEAIKREFITNNININWNYVFYGITIFIAVYLIISHILEWEFNIENFFTFLFYAIIGVVIAILIYIILKFIWEEIVLPILGGLLLFFGLAGGGGSGGYVNNNGSSSKDCCEYPNREYCRTCPLIDFSKESYDFSGYYWCRDHCAYVDPNEGPEYNSKNLKYR